MTYKTGEVLRRDVRLSRDDANEDERTVDIALSSEVPVQRAFGNEILDHSEGSVRLGRLADGGAVLVGHDPNDHVGVVESVRVDDDSVARARIRFGRSARAEEILQDVIDGIRTKVSVGYVVHKFDRKQGKNGEPDEYRATDWEPHEVSFVSIPADVTVGVGRNFEDNQEGKMMSDDIQKDPQPEVEAPQIDVKAERSESAKAERERVNDILRVADEHNATELAREYIDKGKSVGEFYRGVLAEIGKRNAKKRVDNPVSDEIGLSPKEKRQYSLVRAMRTMAMDHLEPQNARKAREEAAFELEVSDAAAKQLGIDVRGIFVPSDIHLATRADLSAGTATDGAELVSTDLLAGSFIDVLRNQTAVFQAGARMLPGLVGDVAIPRKTSGSAATWISAEDGDATQSDPQFDQVTLAPKDLGCYTQVTRRLLQQATPGIEAIVRDDLAQGMALAIDLAGLYGSGVAGQPVGIASTTGINTATFSSSQPTYAELVQMVTECKLDNADMGSTAFITDPNGWDAAMTTEKASNTAEFVWEPGNTVVGRRAFVTNQVDQGDWFFGNFADLLVGMWGGLELNVDPYTHSLKGKIRYVTFQTIDLAVRHAVSFVRGNSGSTA